MNLEKLVADRELCEQIPAGEFLDTAFCWHYTEVAGFICGNGCKQFSGKQWQLERSTSGKITRYRQRGEQIYPAPTLQEILEDLTKLCVTPEIFHAHKNYWTAQGETLDDDGMYKYHHGYSSNPSTAALKLWLELNKKGN